MKINLEKACIGFLIGILLFCVCNKMFLIEGITTNTCHDNQCIGDGSADCKASCNENLLCFDPGAKKCNAVGMDPVDPSKCTDAGFKWCGSEDTPSNCAEAISNANCIGDQEDNPDGIVECVSCSEGAVGEHRSVGECEKYIEEFCVGTPTPPSPPAPTPPAPGPTPPAPGPAPGPTPPTPDKFTDQNITMEIVNNYGFPIMLFMRANNDWASSVNFDKPAETCGSVQYQWDCQPNTRYVNLNDGESLIMTFSNSTVIESFKAWFIKKTDPPGKLGNGFDTWVKIASSGPQPGTTDFEFNLTADSNIDANISYVDGINSKMDFYIYKKGSKKPVAENVCDFSRNPPVSEDFQRWQILGMPVVFASKHALSSYTNDGNFTLLNDATLWATDKAKGGDYEYDRCPPEHVTDTAYQHKCRTHMASKIQRQDTYCGYLMRAGCPYCWGLGEFYCVDPDKFNSMRDTDTTCGERIIAATQGTKALGCGYNVDGINHFNWPNSVAELGIKGVSTEPNNYSMGSKPFDTPQYMDVTGGDNYSTFWYNTKPGIDAGPKDFDNKLPSNGSPLNNCTDDSNWNFGAMEMKSLNSLSLGNDAYYFRVEINSIPWLKL